MARFVPYSRHELRRSRIEWFKRNIKMAIVLTAGAVALICIELCCWYASCRTRRSSGTCSGRSMWE